MPLDAPAHRFVSRRRVSGTVQEAADVLSDPRELSRWWPEVHPGVEEIARAPAKPVVRDATAPWPAGSTIGIP